jgi:hypothetical protein
VAPGWDPRHSRALLELDAALHPDRVGEVGLDGLDAVIDYAAASAMKAQADKTRLQARARLAELAAGARYVKFGDDLAYQFDPVTRRDVDLDLLADQWPDVYDRVVTTTRYHKVRLAPAYRRGDTP